MMGLWVVRKIGPLCRGEEVNCCDRRAEMKPLWSRLETSEEPQAKGGSQVGLPEGKPGVTSNIERQEA